MKSTLYCTLHNKNNVKYLFKYTYLSHFGKVVKLCLLNVTRPVGTENAKEINDIIDIKHILKRISIYFSVDFSVVWLTRFCDSPEIAQQSFEFLNFALR